MKKYFLIFILFLIISRPKFENKLLDMKTIYVYDKFNNLIYHETNNIDKSIVKLENINESVIKSLIFMEDNLFYEHHGFNIYKICEAIYKNILNKKNNGASTISQQLAKNLFLTNEKKLSRKIKELYYSINLEFKYSKNEILEAYLNTIYFSNNIYGIKDASNFYFNKNPIDLSYSEAISLFIITNNPSIYDPFKNKLEIINKKDLILNKMYKLNLINLNTLKNNLGDLEFFKNKVNTYNFIHYFIIELKNELKKLNINKSIKVYTSFNPLIKNIPLNKPLERSFIVANKDYLIEAIEGGNSYLTSINHIHLNRSVCSTIKPFIYYNAIIHGQDILKNINTLKRDFIFHDELYSPSNYNDSYQEYSNMAYSLATSSNIYSCLMTLKYFNSLEETLKLFNISFIPYLSIALGANLDSLFNLTNAYLAILNEGYYNELSCIKEIYDLNNNLLYKKKDKYKLFNSEAMKSIKSMLSLTSDSNIDYSTLNKLNGFSKKTLAKSGSDDYNSWIIGMSDNYVVGVWNGFDNLKKINKSCINIYEDIFNKIDDEVNFSTNKSCLIYNNYYKDLYYPDIIPKKKL